jgi:hypothetical protein
MRHEAPVQLIEHPVRKLIPEDHNLTDAECNQIVGGMTITDLADYETIQDEFAWPSDWIVSRRILLLYASTSEFQLLQYLKGEVKHVADKRMHAISGRL